VGKTENLRAFNGNLRNHVSKMLTIFCDCGAEVLIVPDVAAMNNALRNHRAVHMKFTGRLVSEDNLAEKVIEALSKNAPICLGLECERPNYGNLGS